MFTKLLKQEWIATRRLVPLIYLITVVMIMTNLLARQLGIQWLSNVLLVLLIILGVAELLMTYVLVFYRYYKNLYDSEGYLTHTLPVRPTQLLTSKIVISFFWLFLSYLVLFGVILTVVLLVSSDQGQSLSQTLEQIIAGTGLITSSFYWAAGLVAAYVCLAIFSLMAQVFFAITMGNLSRFHSLGVAGPIICYMGVYFCTQLLTLAGLLTVPLGLTVEDHRLRLVPQSMLVTFINPDQVVIGLGSVLAIVLYTVGLFVATAQLMKRHTSLK